MNESTVIVVVWLLSNALIPIISAHLYLATSGKRSFLIFNVEHKIFFNMKVLHLIENCKSPAILYGYV